MRATTLPPPRLAITVSLSCQSLGPVDRLVRDCAYADATGFTLRAPEPPPVRVRCHRETRRVRGRKSHS